MLLMIPISCNVSRAEFSV